MADIAIVTANLGGHDVLHPQAAQDIDADWFYFTDERLDVPEPWQRVLVCGRVPNEPRLYAKRYRMIPWDVLDKLGDYRRIIWIDAGHEVTNPAFAREAVECLPDGVQLVAFQHPRRTTIVSEVEGSLTESPKYDHVAERMREQVQTYLDDGYPDLALYATGTMVWNATDPLAHKLGEFWLAENELWTIQDQLSLPYAAWRVGARIATFPYHQVPRRRDKNLEFIQNHWLKIHQHTRTT